MRHGLAEASRLQRLERERLYRLHRVDRFARERARIGDAIL